MIFKRIKKDKRKRGIGHTSLLNEENYNLSFSVTELKQSLQRTNDSALVWTSSLSAFNAPSRLCFISSCQGVQPRLGIGPSSAIVARSVVIPIPKPVKKFQTLGISDPSH